MYFVAIGYEIFEILSWGNILPMSLEMQICRVLSSCCPLLTSFHRVNLFATDTDHFFGWLPATGGMAVPRRHNHGGFRASGDAGCPETSVRHTEARLPAVIPFCQAVAWMSRVRFYAVPDAV